MDKMISTGGTTLLLMGLASSALCSTASADFEDGQIEFSFEFSENIVYYFPLLTNFFVDASYDDGEGTFQVPGGSGSVDIVAGDFSGTREQTWLPMFPGTVIDAFEAEFVIFDMPYDYGDMRIELVGEVGWEPDFRQWGGTVTGTASPYTPFGDGGSPLSGTWSAQIVPAPGAIALLGLGGLARRRRRD
ncbi:MAG: hypothetical protein GY871_13420 [Actinomycetales bacterium]|nr:hypothetical protein [Actinomycetales bacterium]